MNITAEKYPFMVLKIPFVFFKFGRDENDTISRLDKI